MSVQDPAAQVIFAQPCIRYMKANIGNKTLFFHSMSEHCQTRCVMIQELSSRDRRDVRIKKLIYLPYPSSAVCMNHEEI